MGSSLTISYNKLEEKMKNNHIKNSIKESVPFQWGKQIGERKISLEIFVQRSPITDESIICKIKPGRGMVGKHIRHLNIR